MFSFRELFTNNEKSDVIDLLKNKKLIQWNSKNYENFWHTTRMLQSISNPIMDKKMFVNKNENIKVVLCNFETKRQRIAENFEVWIDDNLSDDEINLIGNSLLEMANDIVGENKIPFFRTIPINLADKLRKQPLQSQIHLSFEQMLGDYFMNDIIDIPLIDGFEIHDIPVEKVDMIVENWKYGREQDKEWMKASIENCPSLGIWDLSSNEMIGQMIYMTTGTFGGLKIDQSYRGLGLAKMLISRMAMKIKEKMMTFIIEIELENIASKSLFEKLEFECLSRSTYMVFDRCGSFLCPGQDF